MALPAANPIQSGAHQPRPGTGALPPSGQPPFLRQALACLLAGIVAGLASTLALMAVVILLSALARAEGMDDGLPRIARPAYVGAGSLLLTDPAGGYRDTHFRFLKDLHPGDEPRLRTIGGHNSRYRIVETLIADAGNSWAAREWRRRTLADPDHRLSLRRPGPRRPAALPGQGTGQRRNEPRLRDLRLIHPWLDQRRPSKTRLPMDSHNQSPGRVIMAIQPCTAERSEYIRPFLTRRYDIMTVLMLEELSVDLDDTAPKASLIETLMADLAREHEADPPRLIETHISWVILQGEDAWKIKKPVNLGFLDFSSLERRHQACLDELRLNRRLAPDIYLDVVPITRTWGRPRLDGEGEVLDYAVHMRRFDPDQGLDRLLTAGRLDDDLFDTLARRIAAFHEAAAVAGPDQVRGGPQQFTDPALANYPPLAKALGDDNELRLRLKHLEHWTRQQAKHLQSIFRQRLADGHVRECHGDLHLGNIVLEHDRLLIFDCIEFNPGLRWIDTLSDLAFLLMDLDHHQRPDLAWRVLNTYLEETGDYAGLALLDFYRTYRAQVRAKVNAIRLGQTSPGDAGANEARRQCLGYIGQAQTYTTPRQPALLITCGVSGSGKTHYSRQLSRQLGAIHLRSDIERKRLFGLKPLQSSDGLDIYTAEASGRTFRRLRQLAGQLLDAGHSVIVDATFIERARREDFRQLAEQHQAPFRILLFDPAPETLRQRLRQRLAAADDVSEADIAVMEAQLHRFERPEVDEGACHHIGDNDGGDDAATIKRKFSLVPP